VTARPDIDRLDRIKGAEERECGEKGTVQGSLSNEGAIFI
jgi:hypothetical protein